MLDVQLFKLKMLTEFQKSNAAKILACYNTEENELEKGGGQKYIRKYIGKNGKWIYVYNDNNYQKNSDKYDELVAEHKELRLDLRDLRSDMENDPEHINEVETTGGGVIAQQYGARLNDIEEKLSALVTEINSINTSGEVEVESDEYVPASLLQSMNKISRSEEIDIKKSGEGSRGGKIIGHTTTGKPIYESHSHESHKNFSKQEHLDAAKFHKENKNNFRKEQKENESKTSSLKDEEMFGDNHKVLLNKDTELSKKIKQHDEEYYKHIDSAIKLSK